MDEIVTDELQKSMKTAYDWLVLTDAIAADYDGYRSPEGLMSLIDEMRAYVREAIVCIIEENKY